MTKPRAILWLESETGASIDVGGRLLPPGPNDVVIRLDRELVAALREQADRRGVTLQGFVEQTLRDSIECEPV